jgi:hypothetical protein
VCAVCVQLLRIVDARERDRAVTAHQANCVECRTGFVVQQNTRLPGQRAGGRGSKPRSGK